MYRCVGTLLLCKPRNISSDCACPTRGSFSPTKKIVGVFTRATSFTGDAAHSRSIGASFCHGVPPNHGIRYARISDCANSEIQFAMLAPADAALKRSVVVI